MRAKNELSYNERKACVRNVFEWMGYGWTPQNCIEYLIDEQNWSDGFEDTTVFLFVLSIAAEEIRRGVLEQEVLLNSSYHIYRYENMGRYGADLTAEEVVDVEKDIAYIKSKVELPELESYEDIVHEDDDEEDEG